MHVGVRVLHNLDVDSETFRYKATSGTTSDGLPFVVEAAFAELSDADNQLQIITGCDFSPAVDRPCVRLLDSLLEHQMIEEDSPVVVLLHVATPAPTYLDRGKSVIDATGELETAVEKCVVNVTSEWKKQRKLEERDARQAERRRAERLRSQRPKTNLNEAIVEVLPEAIKNASGGGVCEFSQRDLYYATRQLVQRFTDKPLTQKWFDQVIDEYEKANDLIEGKLRDPRGFLLEPHTGKKIPLGTKAVDEYEIPLHLYNTILFFEKKGMESKCAWGQIPERFDCAIMACEGYAVRAAKALIQAAQRRHKMKVFCFHDADPAGYNIKLAISKATGAHNYFVEVIDAGLHLQEALDMGLAVETFFRKKRLLRELKLTELEQETAPYHAGVKCKGYRLASRFLGDLCVRVPVTDPILAKRIEAEQRRQQHEDQRTRWKPIHYMLDAEQQFVTITTDVDEVLLGLPDHSRLCQSVLIDRIRRRELPFSVSSTGRVFNAITGLTRELRTALRLAGEPMGSVDIRCAQPALLAMLMTAGFPPNGLKGAETYKHTLPALPALALSLLPSEDASTFSALASSGLLYESLMADSCLSRDVVKLALLRDVLAKRGRYPSAVEEAFRDAFPTVLRVIRTVNREDHGELIRLLQRAESWLVVETVAPRLLRRIPAVTLHDAIFSGTDPQVVVARQRHLRPGRPPSAAADAGGRGLGPCRAGPPGDCRARADFGARVSKTQCGSTTKHCYRNSVP